MSAVADTTGQVTLTYGDVPPSLNALGMRGSNYQLHAAKKRWQSIFGDLLLYSKLPRGCDRVEASAVLQFTTRRSRDTGNFRFLCEKALGDALTPVWIPDDDADRYEFGTLRFELASQIHFAPCTIVTLDYWSKGAAAA